MTNRRPEEVLPDYAHLAGCPQRPERIEMTEVSKRDGARALVVRCCDCGAQRVEGETN